MRLLFALHFAGALWVALGLPRTPVSEPGDAALAWGLAALGASVLLAWRLRATRGPGPKRPAGLGLRLFVYGLCVGLVPTSLAPQSADALPLLVSGAVLGTAVALQLWLLAAPDRGGRAWLRVVDVGAANLLLFLLLGEGVLRGFQRIAPSALLWNDSSAASNVLALRRCDPGVPGGRCNSRGYPDEEFFEPTPSDYSVALLADSFGVGSVPWRYHFATLAENELRAGLGNRYARVAIDVFGVSGADLPEYAYLFDTEIRDVPYAQVVLSLFVGNDLKVVPPRGPLERLERLQSWLVPTVVIRSWLVLRGVEPPKAVDLEAEPAYLHDPSLEPPYFKPEAFLAVEADRLKFVVRGGSFVTWSPLFAELERLHAILGSRLLVTLIPDEYQVNDELWRDAVAYSAEHNLKGAARESPEQVFDRELPQKRIGAWATEHGVRLLDYLPALRKAQRWSRTYHLRDTHWNAHGNEVAARELARALLDHALATAPD